MELNFELEDAIVTLLQRDFELTTLPSEEVFNSEYITAEYWDENPCSPRLYTHSTDVSQTKDGESNIGDTLRRAEHTIEMEVWANSRADALAIYYEAERIINNNRIRPNLFDNSVLIGGKTLKAQSNNTNDENLIMVVTGYGPSGKAGGVVTEEITLLGTPWSLETSNAFSEVLTIRIKDMSSIPRGKITFSTYDDEDEVFEFQARCIFHPEFFHWSIESIDKSSQLSDDFQLYAIRAMITAESLQVRGDGI